MRRSFVILAMLCSAGCVNPLSLQSAASDCATVKIRGETAVTYQCGVPEHRQHCAEAGAPTVLPYAGAYATIRCSAQGDAGLASR